MKYTKTPAPAFMDDLIIYEIATKGFTSPNGPQSGTFSSLKEKIPYLEELGVNGIWLSGNQLCDCKHFYNVWTQYAVIRPDEFDPSLGTDAEFKDLIDVAHSHGIRVFLDVITHGLMDGSPIIKEHPEWFSGGSWGMVDFDWYGGHDDLDQWWVDTWVDYVLKFGIDGYRLDVTTYRNDLWALVRKKAKEAGREIMIITEHSVSTDGSVDAIQSNCPLGTNFGLVQTHPLLTDVAGYCNDRSKWLYDNVFLVEIEYSDGTVHTSRATGATGHNENGVRCLNVVRLEDQTEHMDCDKYGVGYVEHRTVLRIENVDAEREINEIRVFDLDSRWYEPYGHEWNTSLPDDNRLIYSRDKSTVIARFPQINQRGQYMTTQLSCHDCGWDGFTLGENPYIAQGSRYVMGYASMLTPTLPIMMSGEEFDASYRPLPEHSPKLFGGEGFGEGRWLYASWLDWDELGKAGHAEMLADTKKILAIRREYAHLIKPMRFGLESETPVIRVPYRSEKALPLPYAYVGKDEVVIIAANPNTEESVELTFDLTGLLGKGQYQVESMFGDADEKRATVTTFSEMEWIIAPDKTSNGGLLVLAFKRTGN